jgi:putative transposase
VQKDEKLSIEKRRKRNQPSKTFERIGIMGKYALERMPYPSDVTDEEWAILEPLIPAAKPGGRPQEIARREIVNGILYVLRSGCPWRLLPHDLPHWSTVHLYFREWKLAGIWEQVNAALRREVRVGLGRDPEPSAAILDSQSIKSSSVRGDKRGYDGGKKISRQKTAPAGGHPGVADVCESAGSFLG